MAIDTWMTGTIDPAAAKKPDAVDHVHNLSRNTTNVGDFVVAFDRAKVKSKTVLRSAVMQALKAIDGGNELSA